MIASNGNVEIIKYFLILFVAITARGAAMSINRITGKKYDMVNPRKKSWALVTGELKKKDAIIFTTILIILFEVFTYMLNNIVFILSPIVLAFFIVDPLLKRVTCLRHLFMGFTIGLGIIGGFLAITPVFPPLIIYLIVAASTFWIAGFDIIYTIPDRIYDKENGLKTIIVKYGMRKGLIVSIIFHLLTIVFFISIAFIVNSIYYVVSLIPIIFLIIYGHIGINGDDAVSIRKAFFNTNSLIGLIFLLGIWASVFLKI